MKQHIHQLSIMAHGPLDYSTLVIFIHSDMEVLYNVCVPTRALKIMDDEAESHTEDAAQLQQLVDTRVKCYNNLAAAQLKVT